MTELIESDPEILGGKPVIKGTRIPVDLIFELIGANEPISEILEDYPSLTKDKIIKLIEIGKNAKKYLNDINLEQYLNQEL